MAPRRYLSSADRMALLRETFEIIASVGFAKWRREELVRGKQLTDEHRHLYFKHFEQRYWPEFQKKAANAPDDRLMDVRDDWIEMSNAIGLLEWQERKRVAEELTMKLKEHVTEDSQTHMRRLLAEYSARGRAMLAKLSRLEIRLLVKVKETHLKEIEERCSRDECLKVNVPLWMILTKQVKEISGELKARERDLELER